MFNPVFFILSPGQSFEMFPKHSGHGKIISGIFYLKFNNIGAINK